MCHNDLMKTFLELKSIAALQFNVMKLMIRLCGDSLHAFATLPAHKLASKRLEYGDPKDLGISFPIVDIHDSNLQVETSRSIA